jgi:hypothetical protein
MRREQRTRINCYHACKQWWLCCAYISPHLQVVVGVSVRCGSPVVVVAQKRLNRTDSVFLESRKQDVGSVIVNMAVCAECIEQSTGVCVTDHINALNLWFQSQRPSEKGSSQTETGLRTCAPVTANRSESPFLRLPNIDFDCVLAGLLLRRNTA